MIHYHGTPITPHSEMFKMAGKHFCVCFNDARNIDWCVANGQSVMLDNGAFSAFTQGRTTDFKAYEKWIEPYLYPPNWCVIPDVIDGTIAQQKQLMQTLSGANFRYDLAQGGGGNLNGVAGEKGLNFDSRVGSYDGIPIFISQHVEKDTTSRIHLLDMENLAMRIAAPTTYVDNTNLAIRQQLSREYAFITAGELIVYRFNTQGSVRNLNA